MTRLLCLIGIHKWRDTESGYYSACARCGKMFLVRMGGDSLENVRTLCGKCHRLEHAYGKSGVKPCKAKEKA